MSKIKGFVKLQVFAEGSKSESLRPYILFGNGGKLLLYKKDDNPFENQSLKDFIDKFVYIEGELVNEVFEVETIRIIETEQGIMEE